MLRIVGIQRDTSPDREFILLQNQGSLRVTLKGHALLSDRTFATGDMNSFGHAFLDEEAIPSGMFVLLRSGVGEGKWGKTKEGQLVFHAFMNRDASVWDLQLGAIHVLKAQHTFAERAGSERAVEMASAR